MKITGACFCGKIHYALSEIPTHTTMCHCSRCRKVFSGTGSAFAHIDPTTFSWTTGEENLQTYLNEDGLGLGFCKTCGSTLCGIDKTQNTKHQVIGITLGTLNDDPPIKITEHIFVGSKACWDEIGGNVVQYEEHKP
ncbi:MAG: GFA family protein [Parvibaculaceae bacterium]|nr:GFA family protein [Parvibaculaceae bacterium]